MSKIITASRTFLFILVPASLCLFSTIAFAGEVLRFPIFGSGSQPSIDIPYVPSSLGGLLVPRTSAIDEVEERYGIEGVTETEARSILNSYGQLHSDYNNYDGDYRDPFELAHGAYDKQQPKTKKIRKPSPEKPITVELIDNPSENLPCSYFDSCLHTSKKPPVKQAGKGSGILKNQDGAGAKQKRNKKEYENTQRKQDDEKSLEGGDSGSYGSGSSGDGNEDPDKGPNKNPTNNDDGNDEEEEGEEEEGEDVDDEESEGEKEEKKLTLTDLPYDCICVISEYLPIEDVGSLVRICKYFYNAVLYRGGCSSSEHFYRERLRLDFSEMMSAMMFGGNSLSELLSQVSKKDAKSIQLSIGKPVTEVYIFSCMEIYEMLCRMPTKLLRKCVSEDGGLYRELLILKKLDFTAEEMESKFFRLKLHEIFKIICVFDNFELAKYLFENYGDYIMRLPGYLDLQVDGGGGPFARWLIDVCKINPGESTVRALSDSSCKDQKLMRLIIGKVDFKSDSNLCKKLCDCRSEGNPAFMNELLGVENIRSFVEDYVVIHCRPTDRMCLRDHSVIPWEIVSLLIKGGYEKFAKELVKDWGIQFLRFDASMLCSCSEEFIRWMFEKGMATGQTLKVLLCVVEAGHVKLAERLIEEKK